MSGIFLANINHEGGMKMRRLTRFLVVMAVASLSYACSSSSEKAPPSLQYDPPAELNAKSGQTWTETDLDADSQLAFTENNNVVVFLSDPFEPEPDADISGVDLGGVRGADTVPLEISTADIYKMCLILNDDAWPVSLTLADSLERQLLRIDNVGEETHYFCRDIHLEPGDYRLTLENAHEFVTYDMPFLLTFEGQTIAVKYNNFSYADLRATDLSNRQFVNTTFVGANLDDVRFLNTRMYSNDFTDASMSYMAYTSAFVINPTGELPPPPLQATPGDQRKGFHMYATNQPLGFGLGKLNMDHTYPAVYQNVPDLIENTPYTRHSWSAYGRKTGGKILKGTETVCKEHEDCIDLQTVNFIMSKAPCYWPKKGHYARTGVCWNITNRGLYYTNKTVSNVPWYSVVETMFGTYGGELNSWYSRDYSWAKCLAEVRKNNPWEGWDYLSPNVAMMLAGQESETLNPRIALYHEYADSNEQGSSGVSAMSAVASMSTLQYLQELLKLNIAEKVGEISPSALSAMLDAHEEMYYALRSLDGIGEAGEDFNAITRGTLEKYLLILGVDDYLKLMNLDEFPKGDFDILDFQ